MRAKDRTGVLGEDVAAEFLTGLGYRVLERRWRTPRGELDLIVEDAQCLVAVEVKARRGLGFGHPLEAVDQQKLRRLHVLLHEYAAAQRPSPGGRAGECDVEAAGRGVAMPGRVAPRRVDIVSVVLGPVELDGVIAPEIEHLRDVSL